MEPDDSDMAGLPMLWFSRSPMADDESLLKQSFSPPKPIPFSEGFCPKERVMFTVESIIFI